MLKKKKITKMNSDKSVIEKIPFIRLYPENGIIESKPYFYTKTYQLFSVENKDILDSDLSLYSQKMQDLLNNFGLEVTMQFTCFNKKSTEDLVEKELLLKNEADENVKIYNDVIRNNMHITNNSIIQTKYFTIGFNADTAEDAIEQFKVIDCKVIEQFKEIYNMPAKPLNITERCHLLYDAYNPNVEQFGKIVGLEGDEINLDYLRRLKLTFKDLIAPQSLSSKVSYKNHIILNENTYVRSFFVNTIPKKVADFFLADITNAVGNLIYTLTVKPIEATIGLEASRELVLNNTDVKTIKVRDTVDDRRNKRTKQVESMINTTEADYFNKQALELCTEATGKGQNIFACSAIITIYANDLDTLENYTDLIRISSGKYAVQIKSLDVQQLQGFNSALPLCNMKVDVKRILNAERTVNLIPIDFHNISKQSGSYYGLNTFTDSLVVLNRRNSSNYNGLITGARSSGKTYQTKREIFNQMITSNDNIYIISMNKEYNDFVKRFNGHICDFTGNAFLGIDDYALKDDVYDLKEKLFKGIINIVNNRTNDYVWAKRETEKEENELKRIQEIINTLEDEILGTNVIEINTLLEKIGMIDAEKQAFKVFDIPETDDRLQLLQVNNVVDLIKAIDYVWIRAINDIKSNKKVNIYVDYMDDLFNYPGAKDYIYKILEYTNILQIPFTFVLQNPADMAIASNYDFDKYVTKIGYIKLLCQGVKERNYFSELLNIPNILTRYISLSELGHVGTGLIITNTVNIAFDDSYLNQPEGSALDKFNNIFKKEQEDLEKQLDNFYYRKD